MMSLMTLHITGQLWAVFREQILVIFLVLWFSELRVDLFTTALQHIVYCILYTNDPTYEHIGDEKPQDTYTHQHRNPPVVAAAAVVEKWGHGKVAVERCSHCHWSPQECHRVLQGCHNCPSMEEQKAPQDPPAPQDRTRILASLADCLCLLSEAGCTSLRSHLNTAVIFWMMITMMY